MQYRFCLIPFLALSAFAQTSPWTAPLRGAWVQTGPAGPGDVTLAARDNVAQIVVGDDEPSNVRQGAEFLAGDIEMISGFKPVIVKAATNDKVNIRLVTLGHGEIPAAVNTAGMQGQWESYRVVTEGRNVWLVGSNPRGAAFACYTLSERLGVDPLYIWTGYRPDHHDPLILKKTDFAQGPPTFKYRGFFHDDEDLLPRPFDNNGYPKQTGDVPLEWYKRYFETALRLKMNMVAPYTRVHRRFEVQKTASDWGLYYTSHHYDILVSNPFGFPANTFNLAEERGVKPEYNWFTNKEGMLKFWKGGLDENKSLDVIWPVGMRGTNDVGFRFPEGTTDEQKAATFREVIADQVKMVKAEVKDPVFHFTMYTEMLPLYQKNPAAFDLPEDVIIIWPDDNDGHMRGLPSSLGKWKHGVYYHLAYLGGNLSKQTTHTVTPQVIGEEFHKIVNAGATEYMLVNMSEVRDYIMGARMIADICWNAPAVYKSPDPAARYTSWWSKEYFPQNAAAVDGVYDKYFTLLDKPDTMWSAMTAIQTLIGSLYTKIGGGAPAAFNADTLQQLQTRVRTLDEALGAEQQAENALPLTEARFLSIDTGLGMKIADFQTHAAIKLADALAAPDAGALWKNVFEARDYLEKLETAFARGEYAPFERWYHESWIRSAYSNNNPHRAYNELRDFIGQDGHGSLPTPPGRGGFGLRPGGPGRGGAPAGPGRGGGQ